MIMKIYVILAAIVLQVAVLSSRAQETNEARPGDRQVSSSASVSLPRAILERLANLTQEDNLWLLIPSNASDTSQLNESDFSLFKLNTGQLLDQSHTNGDDWVSATAQVAVNGDQPGTEGSRSPRSARKMNLFKSVLGKPQVSPLYLVNGTVCRFVNSQPICTTLSTTGLFRGQNPGSLQQQGGQFQGNNNQQQQGQLLTNQLQQPNQRQVSPQNFGQFQPLRPMAVLDNEQQTISVASASGETNLTSRAQQVHRPTGAGGGQSLVRPVLSYTVRRPLNLLSLGRPFRSGR